MSFRICFALALVILFLTGAFVLHRRKTHKGPRTFYLIFIGVALSAVAVLFPVYLTSLDAGATGLKAFLLSVHNMIRLFVVDDDFSLVREQIAGLGGVFGRLYWFLSVLLYLAAPMLTFGVVLSFFRNLISERQYLFRYFKSVYAFSQLNEKSLALAKDLKKGEPKAVILFAGVGEEPENGGLLCDDAEEIGAICFTREISDINFGVHSKKSPITFFVMAQEDDTRNIDDALKLIERYKERDLVRLYIFSFSVTGEILFENIDCGKIRLQRIEEGQKLVSSLLYERGHVLFDSAVPDEKTGEKKITALVIGLGRNGTEMISSLPWFCQMTGYRIEIHAFDANPQAEDLFVASCPELMHPDYNGKAGTDLDACYTIRIHSGVDIYTGAFEEALNGISGISYVFISMGNDEENLKAARNIRMLTARMGANPYIQTVILRPTRELTLTGKGQEKDIPGLGLSNFKGQGYGIEFVGSRAEQFSRRVMLNSELEMAALARHLKWGEEKQFWQIEYNYRSSIASALHHKYKIYCGVPGADKAPEERTEQDREALRRLEHRRWNAYMRSVGYVYAEVRNEMAKTHNCLVPFDQLSEKEQKKDDD